MIIIKGIHKKPKILNKNYNEIVWSKIEFSFKIQDIIKQI